MYGIEVEGWQLFLKEAGVSWLSSCHGQLRCVASRPTLPGMPASQLQKLSVLVEGEEWRRRHLVPHWVIRQASARYDGWDGWQQSYSSSPKVAPDKASWRVSL